MIGLRQGHVCGASSLTPQPPLLPKPSLKSPRVGAYARRRAANSCGSSAPGLPSGRSSAPCVGDRESHAASLGQPPAPCAGAAGKPGVASLAGGKRVTVPSWPLRPQRSHTARRPASAGCRCSSLPQAAGRAGGPFAAPTYGGDCELFLGHLRRAEEALQLQPRDGTPDIVLPRLASAPPGGPPPGEECAGGAQPSEGGPQAPTEDSTAPAEPECEAFVQPLATQGPPRLCSLDVGTDAGRGATPQPQPPPPLSLAVTGHAKIASSRPSSDPNISVPRPRAREVNSSCVASCDASSPTEHTLARPESPCSSDAESDCSTPRAARELAGKLRWLTGRRTGRGGCAAPPPSPPGSPVMKWAALPALDPSLLQARLPAAS